MKAQMHKQSTMRSDKHKIPKGKLIVTEAHAKQAIATGKYLLRKAMLYHTSHIGEELVCVPDDSLQHGMPTLRSKLMSEYWQHMDRHLWRHII
jgi:hypothetical protein